MRWARAVHRPRGHNFPGVVASRTPGGHYFPGVVATGLVTADLAGAKRRRCSYGCQASGSRQRPAEPSLDVPERSGQRRLGPYGGGRCALAGAVGRGRRPEVSTAVHHYAVWDLSTALIGPKVRSGEPVRPLDRPRTNRAWGPGPASAAQRRCLAGVARCQQHSRVHDPEDSPVRSTRKLFTIMPTAPDPPST